MRMFDVWVKILEFLGGEREIEFRSVFPAIILAGLLLEPASG